MLIGKRWEKKDKIWERTKGWFEDIHLTVAYNTEDKLAQPYQYGGVLNITKNRMAHKVIGSGYDSRRWGRWAWTKYGGIKEKHNC